MTYGSHDAGLNINALDKKLSVFIKNGNDPKIKKARKERMKKFMKTRPAWQGRQECCTKVPPVVKDEDSDASEEEEMVPDEDMERPLLDAEGRVKTRYRELRVPYEHLFLGDMKYHRPKLYRDPGETNSDKNAAEEVSGNNTPIRVGPRRPATTPGGRKPLQAECMTIEVNPPTPFFLVIVPYS